MLTSQRFLSRITIIKATDQRNVIACHHCEGAPCVRSCPNDAIAQSGDSVRISREKCIGYKSCMVACPFGMMQVVVTPQTAGLVKANALKYDLYRDHETGLACVENYPVRAPTLTDGEALTALAKQRQLRSVCQEMQPWQRGTLICSQPSVGAKVRQMAVTPPREEPGKLAVEVRRSHFEEIYQPFIPAQAQQQTARCLTCGGHSTCEQTCSLYNHIPQRIGLTKAGDIAAAVALSYQTNCLSGITGRVCPQDRLCKDACTPYDKSDAVTIGNIKRYTPDQALASGWRPDLPQVKPSDKRMAIIGARPAGLACASVLVRHGVQPAVSDRHPGIGGLLTFGIPAFRLDRPLLARRWAIFSEMGIRFKLSCEVGRDIPMATLLADYDTMFVGAGTYHSMRARLPNEEAPGVYDALPLLITNTKQAMGLAASTQEPCINTAGLNVVMLGGGDTAMDYVCTVLRHGAHQMTCVYRRDEASMPGSKKEAKNTRGEGAVFESNVQPMTLELDENGRADGVHFLRTELGAPDAGGRRRPTPIPGSEFVMPVGAVIMAFGFHPHRMPWLEAVGAMLDSQGRIKAGVESHYRYQTSQEKIFAGDDVVRGADLVVTTMVEGRHAARGVLGYLALKTTPLH